MKVQTSPEVLRAMKDIRYGFVAKPILVKGVWLRGKPITRDNYDEYYRIWREEMENKWRA